MDWILDSLQVVQLPMRSKFRGITTREVALFKGEAGWAEFSPFLEYDEYESANWLRSAIEAATKHDFPVNRRSIKINGTIPATDNEAEIERLVASYPGAEVFKVKVGSELHLDLERVALVKKYAPTANLRIDVNGSWSVTEAISNIQILNSEIGTFEYIEQPVATLEELRELKSKLPIAVMIAGDEVIRKARDPLSLDLREAIDILMLKASPLGGIKRSLEIAAHYRLPVVVSSALESAVGITHELRLAAALPELEFACGLATGSLFTDDLATHRIENGAITITNPEPNLEAIARLAAPRERLEWWRERIKGTLEVMV